ncbi:MAG: threonine/serine dehydratase [Alphaproteobacteria bacterium]
MSKPHPELPLGLEDIREAASRIAPHAVRTGLITHPALDRATGARVFLKPENLQRTGSFKFRGALNAARALTEAERSRGLLAWSSGNHAQAVALTAKLLNCPATIVMPADAPALKIEATRAHGAQIVLYDRVDEDREAVGRAIAERTGAVIIPPYDHLPTIAGQGTMGFEIVQDLTEAGLAPDIVLVCCGGGGLVAGTALAITHGFPQTAVLAVEPEGFDDTRRSLIAGTRQTNPLNSGSLCDALMAPTPGAVTFPINLTLLAGALAVSEAAAQAAMRFAFSHLKLVLEPGGAVALAALLDGALDFRGQTVVAVLSGGNVDPDLFARILMASDDAPVTVR